MQKTKILHILHEIDFSGAEIMLHHSAKYFIDKDFELYALNTEVKLGSFAKILERSGFTILQLPYISFFSHLKQFHQLLKDHKFNIIHNHTEQSFFWYALLARIHRIKFIYTIHSTFTFSWPVRLKRTCYRLFAKAFLNVKYVAISKSVQKNEEHEFLNKSLLIPNWVNPEIFLPVKNIIEKNQWRQSLDIPVDRFIILTVGTCNENKNQFDVIRAVAMIIKKYKNILYLHIGSGPLRAFLEDKIKEMGLQDHVLFLGQRENVRDFLVASDVFVMTSRYEGLGNALLEAQSCELPAIVYNVNGLRELVTDGKNGFLIEEKHEILAEKIMVLYENPDLAKRMGEESGKLIKANYNMSNSLQQTYDLYNS
jgi:glycosyltransferase involved in cell wall biosynthesis